MRGGGGRPGVQRPTYQTITTPVSETNHERRASEWTATYEIDHMGRKERGASLLEEGLVGIEHAIEPRKKLLGAFGSVSAKHRELHTRPALGAGQIGVNRQSQG